MGNGVSFRRTPLRSNRVIVKLAEYRKLIEAAIDIPDLPTPKGGVTVDLLSQIIGNSQIKGCQIFRCEINGIYIKIQPGDKGSRWQCLVVFPGENHQVIYDQLISYWGEDFFDPLHPKKHKKGKKGEEEKRPPQVVVNGQNPTVGVPPLDASKQGSEKADEGKEKGDKMPKVKSLYITCVRGDDNRLKKALQHFSDKATECTPFDLVKAAIDVSFGFVSAQPDSLQFKNFLRYLKVKGYIISVGRMLYLRTEKGTQMLEPSDGSQTLAPTQPKTTYEELLAQRQLVSDLRTKELGLKEEIDRALKKYEELKTKLEREVALPAVLVIPATPASAN